MLSGDLNAAVANVTPAGGAVVSVSPLGLTDRAAGRIGFTTSLGFPRKLERILRDPRVALAYHTREHGFARPEDYVLAQGDAVVDMRPSPQRLDDILDASDRFFGPGKSGRAWDWLLQIPFRGVDGYPVVVPVEIVGRDHTGFRLLSPPGLLPPGGRRAGLLAHSSARRTSVWP
ncbi:hypothetical protein ACFY2N_26720 [Streptomyces rubiginosohelvolus]|uniref:hypothetical protein n=1 Tax=Streptomyces rubiginosohelvolus TaxID=67362 RepID=UPI0036BDD2D9